MKIKKIVKLFENGNVCVVGLRGKGKDMLMSNVVARRNKPYISNINYGGDFIEFDYNYINMNGNTYRNLLEHNVKKYEYIFDDGTDIYLSDCGIYYPSQYCNELNKYYPSIPVFQALSRHLGQCNFHINVQNLNRVWDKIREQSDTYIACNFCKVLFGKIVIQRITLYDKYESACSRVKPNRIKLGMFDVGEKKLHKQMYIDTFENNNGKVESRLLVYINKSNYDTYHFKEVFANGIV